MFSIKWSIKSFIAIPVPYYFLQAILVHFLAEEEGMSEQPKFNIDEELSAIKSNVMTRWKDIEVCFHSFLLGWKYLQITEITSNPLSTRQRIQSTHVDNFSAPLFETFNHLCKFLVFEGLFACIKFFCQK